MTRNSYRDAINPVRKWATIPGLFVLAVLLISFNPDKSEVVSSNSKYVFGIDFSDYLGRVDWNGVKNSDHPIEFVFMRATMGHNGNDRQFRHNWNSAKKHGYIRGAYHYYRPSENSEKQFRNFASTVHLEAGDFPPILDIEKESRYGTENLRRGILNWLRLAEKHYSIKPVIYTGLNFYRTYLEGYVDDYPLWIASYQAENDLRGIDWSFHQYSDRVQVRGFNGRVDGNNYKGTLEELKAMCISQTTP